MLKYSLCLLGAYILYYAAIILFDLFFKKEKKPQGEAVEEFSLSEFAKTQKPDVATVGIEDVENLRTPKSFLKTELNFLDGKPEVQRPSLEELRRHFEAEEDLGESFGETIQDTSDNQPEKAAAPPSEEAELKEKVAPKTVGSLLSNSQESAAEELQTRIHSKNNYWKELLNMAETTVKLVENYDGQKVYHSTI